MSLLNNSEVTNSSSEIKRHLTAIRRGNLSRPVQLLLETGVLGRDSSFFDYGCGFGDDVRILKENGYEANGWDPHFFPAEPKIKSDIVNLGFVLNVVENPTERLHILNSAFSLTNSVLCVGVMYDTDANRPSGKPFRDGIRTNKATFQKLYTNDELKILLREISPYSHMVGPGISLLFKQKQQLDQFRYQRLHRRPVPIHIPTLATTSAHSQIEKFAAEHDAYWQEFAAFLVDRGRPPQLHESILVEKAQHRRISSKQLFHWAVQELGAEAILNAEQQTKDDLLVFLAMSLFERKNKFSDLDTVAQADVKHFYGSFTNALAHAQSTLLSVGNLQLIEEKARNANIGKVIDDGLFVLSDDVQNLPIEVRLYVMVGSVFFGDVEAADLVKIHLQSNKLTFYICADDDDNEKAKQSIFDAFKIDFIRRKVSYYETNKVPEMGN